MKENQKKRIVQAIKDYLEEDATHFELIWIYHRIFHERFPINSNLPDCEKCNKLKK